MGSIRFAASLALAIGLSAGCTADPAKATAADLVSTVEPTLAELNEWDDYVMTDLGDFGGTYNTAVDINDAGQIVGVSAPTPRDYDGRRAWVSDGTTLTMLPLLDPRYSSTAQAINSSGDILGRSWRPVVWTGGVPRDLNIMYPTLRYARDINDAGTIVGDCDVPKITYDFACFLSAGSTTVMDTTGYRYSSAAAINNAGVVAGSRTSWTTYGAFAWSPGATVTLPPLAPSAITSASAINNHGDIVGRSYVRTGDRATLWRAGTGVAVDLGAVHGNASWATGINDVGAIIGVTEPIVDNTRGNGRPFLWRNGRMRLLPTGNMRLEWGEPHAINNRGDIVGTITLPNNETRAVIWRKR